MAEKKLNVLFISSWYPNRINPLLGIFVKRHAEAVAKYCNVSAIYVCSDEEDGLDENTEDGIYTLRVYYKKVSSAIPLYSQWLKWRKYIKSWAKAIKIYEAKKGRPDIINANVVFPVSAVAIKLKAKWKIPYVITEHWTGYFPEDGRYKGMMLERISQAGVREASAMITVSESLKKQMLSLGLNNGYYVIPNVVDEKAFTISKKNDKATFNFIHISSLDEEQKNLGGIIRAFNAAVKKTPNARLTIVGNGEDTVVKQLKKNIEELRLEDSVVLAGTKTGGELVEAFHKADAFVLFSNYENLPCVILEAMCCGLPVIATNMGDIAAYINPANGLWVEPKNEKQLAEVMEQMINKRSEFNAETIRAGIVNKVTAEAIGKQFLEVYNKVLQR